MTNNSLLFNILERLSLSSWRRTFESSQTLRGCLLKVTLVVFGGYTSDLAISGYLFAKKVVRLVRKSGLLHCALYLKQCSSSLQQAYGGTKHLPQLLPVPIALTRSGLPTIIPAHHRRAIRVGDERSDRLVKLYLSWFTLSKLIALAKPIKRSTFEPITTQPLDNDRIMSIVTQ